MASVNEPIPIPMMDNPVSDTGRFSRPWTQYIDKLNTAVANAGTGVTDGSDAAAGQVGEYLTAAGGPVGLTTGVAADVVTLPLSPGDWDLGGNVRFGSGAATHCTECVAGVSGAAATFGTVFQQIGASFNVGANLALDASGPARFSSNAAQTVHLVARGTFTGGTLTARGNVWARRAR
jgi:hypothetical protein